MTEITTRDRLAGISLHSIRPRSRTAGTRVKRSGRVERYWPLVALVLAQAMIALDVDLPVVRPVLALVTLLGVPTLVLVRRAGIVTDSLPARVLYAFGASLLAVIVVALVLNTVLPVVGVDHPLSPAVLAATWLVIDGAMLLWRADIALLPELSWTRTGRRAIGARFELVQTLAVGAVLLAVMGAIRLNNGEGGTIAFVGQVLAAATLVALMVRPAASSLRWSSSERSDRTVETDSRVIALVGASLLLATSLRGWVITGHDIQAEYLSFQLTNGAQRWQMSALENAYNACLSINILPTVLSQTTGLSGEVVFKVLLQVVFALVPVLTYLFSRRFLSRRLALAATTFTLAFPTFFTDMPYLVRQEMAFFFLALLLLAATEPPRWSSSERSERSVETRWPQLVAVGVFGVGMVLSHYSTTYVMLLALVLALLTMTVLRFLGRHWSRFEGYDDTAAGLVLLNPFVVVFLVLASLTWAGPVTHTGAHAKEVARATVNAITGQGEDIPGSSDTSYSLFSRDETTPRERLDSFVQQTLDYRRENIAPRDLLIRKPTRAELRPALVPVNQAPPTAVGKLLDGVGLAPSDLNAAAKVVAAGLMQVFLIAGLLWLVWRRRIPDPEDTDDSGADGPRFPREVVYLSVGAVGALALIVLVPNLSVDYGVLRAFQQTMLVVAPVMAAGLWLLLRPLGKRLAAGASVAVPVVLLLVLAGVLPALLGGHQPRLAMSNSGTYYDRFYTSDASAQAISWLAQADASTSYRSKIISNRNVGVKLLAATNNAAPIADRLYPTLLTKDAYVYVDSQIVGQGTSTLFYTGDLLTYAYPVKKLDRRMDVVYSSPGTRIYR